MSDQLRFSRRVPDNACNLAWIRIPDPEPLANLSLVETGRYIAENIPLLFLRAAGGDVTGLETLSAGATGLMYLTTYNAVPGSGGLATAISPGTLAYAIPRAGTTAVSPSGFLIQNFTTDMQVFHPDPDETGVWRLKVQDGIIQRTVTLANSDQSWLKNVFAAGDQLIVTYTLPEAQTIPLGTGETIREDAHVLEVSGIIADLVDEHTLQLPHGDLYELRSLRVNEQELIGPSGQLQVSTLTVTGSVPPLGPFTAWDPVAGTLTLDRTLADTDTVVASYRYREFLYLYEGYRDDAGLYHELNLNPSPGHTYDGGRPTAELLNLPLYLYLLPASAYRIRDSFGNADQERKIYSGLRWTNQFLRWERTAASVANTAEASGGLIRDRSTYGVSYFGRAHFISDLPVDSLTTPNLTGATLANLPSAIVLAKLYATAAAGVEAVQVIDARLRGGGLPHELVVGSTPLPGESVREAATYWDESGWDGQPVPLAGVLLVELPSALLSGTNGYQQFTAAEVEALVKSKVAAGIQVVVRYV